jgi:hypothetical protein
MANVLERFGLRPSRQLTVAHLLTHKTDTESRLATLRLFFKEIW